MASGSCGNGTLATFQSFGRVLYVMICVLLGMLSQYAACKVTRRHFHNTSFTCRMRVLAQYLSSWPSISCVCGLLYFMQHHLELKASDSLATLCEPYATCLVVSIRTCRLHNQVSSVIRPILSKYMKRCTHNWIGGQVSVSGSLRVQFLWEICTRDLYLSTLQGG